MQETFASWKKCLDVKDGHFVFGRMRVIELGALLGKTIDKIFDFSADFFLGALSRRPPSDILADLHKMLNDEKYELRSFDELAFKTAIYEKEPQKLVYILKRYIKAERFRATDGKEMWGLRDRNPSLQPKAGAVYGTFGAKVLVIASVLAIALVFTAPKIGDLFSRIVLTTYPPYKCHEGSETVLPGLCYPAEFSMDLPYPVRVSLVINCLLQDTGLQDRYEAGPCTNYLSRAEAREIGMYETPVRGAFWSDFMLVENGLLDIEVLRKRWIEYSTLDFFW